MRVAVLVTSHNRAMLTIRFLDSIYKCDIPDDFSIDVYLLDSNSVDNTRELVRENFKKVILIHGHDDLFWSSGMRYIWNYASHTYDYDFYLWANDDIILYKNAIIEMLNTSKIYCDRSIIGGLLLDENHKVAYSGYKLTDYSIIQNINQPTLCDLINGNFVLVPKSVFRIVGLIDHKYKHSFGDFDYSLTAKRNGICSYISCIPVGICNRDEKNIIWKNPNINFKSRFNNLYSPFSYANPIEFFYYNKKNFSIARAVFYFVLQNFQLIFPRLFIKFHR